MSQPKWKRNNLHLVLLVVVFSPVGLDSFTQCRSILFTAFPVGPRESFTTFDANATPSRGAALQVAHVHLTMSSARGYACLIPRSHPGVALGISHVFPRSFLGYFPRAPRVVSTSLHVDLM